MYQRTKDTTMGRHGDCETNRYKLTFTGAACSLLPDQGSGAKGSRPWEGRGWHRGLVTRRGHAEGGRQPCRGASRLGSSTWLVTRGGWTSPILNFLTYCSGSDSVIIIGKNPPQKSSILTGNPNSIACYSLTRRQKNDPKWE